MPGTNSLLLIRGLTDFQYETHTHTTRNANTGLQKYADTLLFYSSLQLKDYNVFLIEYSSLDVSSLKSTKLFKCSTNDKFCQSQTKGISLPEIIEYFQSKECRSSINHTQFV